MKFPVRCFTQAAGLAQRAGQLFQPKNQIYFAPHQTFFTHRRESSEHDWPEMHNEAKRRPFLSLQFLERGDYRQDVLRARSGIRPISEKTIAKVFVNYSLLILDDLFATKNPRSNKHVQVFALQLAAQRRKTANVRDQ